jgi:hypothetical protein
VGCREASVFVMCVLRVVCVGGWGDGGLNKDTKQYGILREPSGPAMTAHGSLDPISKKSSSSSKSLGCREDTLSQVCF